ncbi:MAG: endonuclease III domain-containing protein [Candidatus Omnitrophica bacterium]|nr:endonuclease III domain-containing protein [Candidatus Omnitrophota bacterium]
MKRIGKSEASPSLLRKIYAAMRRKAGHLHWWPGETPFEIIVGAILTQNTAWTNVEKAIRNLKAARVLTPGNMRRLGTGRLAALIRPAGYFNVKARRLKNFLSHLHRRHGGSLGRMFAVRGKELREQLLSVNGIGPETADSILLYAAGKPFFVVDAYTRRIFSRHGFVPSDVSYQELQSFFMDRLKPERHFFNDYHAQIVHIGKTYCRTKNPACAQCPLEFLYSKSS